MKYPETAVEIQREIEKFNEARRVYKFIILCLYYDVNPCKKITVVIVSLFQAIENIFYQIIINKLQNN